jgi:ribosomal protein L35
MKTWKALKKRIKITKPASRAGQNKKLLKKRAGQNHFNTKERSKTVMGKRRKVRVAKSIQKILSLS